MLSLNKVKRFLKDFGLIIIGFLENIFEKKLNGYSFLEVAGCISLKSIFFQQMRSVLHLILPCSHITSNECNLASMQFLKFLEECSSTLLSSFK